MRAIVVVMLASVCLVLDTSAQVTFDVASIKENRSDERSPTGLRRSPDGGLQAQRFPARLLITVAYRLQPFQLLGVPDWTNDTFYDINARPAAGSTTSREQMSDMLQALLVDRFKLAFHRETRPTDGFALVPVKSGALGPDLRVSTVDCDKTPAVAGCRQVPGLDNSFVVRGAPMWSLVQELVVALNAPVVDQTGLSGPYDFNLRWSPDAAVTDDVPALPTALQEQLGLKLERRRTAAEFFVVDRFERPGPD
jgi:uncharacterized protein (TIGR03435 family)